MAKSLLKQNPWLLDEQQRNAAFRISAASSSAVEGIRKPFAVAPTKIKPARGKAAKSAKTRA
jgi:hypothetical protein